MVGLTTWKGLDIVRVNVRFANGGEEISCPDLESMLLRALLVWNDFARVNGEGLLVGIMFQGLDCTRASFQLEPKCNFSRDLQDQGVDERTHFISPPFLPFSLVHSFFFFHFIPDLFMFSLHPSNFLHPSFSYHSSLHHD